MNLVIVESPAKARTIEKYLGPGYTVLASYGHVRDLPSKDGSVDVEHDFRMTWEASENSEKALAAIAKAVKNAKTLYLASDPDREGEAIAWHVQQVLEEKGLLKKVEVHRVVFYEITKKAVLEALSHPRALNHALIDAYLARRALDYLVGFNLSPVLWRKLPGSRSAGRVQSVALKLITDREDEIERFISEEYWSMVMDCSTEKKERFQAKLSQIEGKKLEKFTLSEKGQTDALLAQLKGQHFAVAKTEEKQVSRNPQPPFITSTLQQEAARKLGFGASQTMRIAQKLYEGLDLGGETVGLITYMRTDSVHMSQDAVVAAREYIAKNFEPAYSTPEPRTYKTKVKNAQEAHESIRPTDFSRTPKQMAPFLDAQQLKLYELIWKRAIASQMANTIKNQVAVDLESQDQKFIFRATGSQLLFDGFLTLYEEGSDQQKEDAEEMLPLLSKDQRILQDKLEALQHFTQPPGRFTEASLVKKLEELGIGRPSTYASILSLLQQRAYVLIEKRAFIPEERGRLVSSFLDYYFKKYVEYSFTADLEEQLDSVSRGQLEWKAVLMDFWTAFHGAIQQTKDLKISDVLDVLDEVLEHHFFKGNADMALARKCPKCESRKLHLKIGKYGAFLGCEGYPECTYIQKIGDQTEATTEEAGEYPKPLGLDLGGQEINVRKGPYGFYVQQEPVGAKDKPKRASLAKDQNPQTITLEEALKLLEFPKVLGAHPETQEEISVGVGRFGPYVKHGTKYISLKGRSLSEVTLEIALDIIKNPPVSKRRIKKA